MQLGVEHVHRYNEMCETLKIGIVVARHGAFHSIEMIEDSLV